MPVQAPYSSVELDGSGRIVESDLPPTVVNALVHGVKGDGVTDDTAAIQTLIGGGGNFVFPKAKYKITTALKLSATVGTTIELQPGAEAIQYSNTKEHIKLAGSEGAATAITEGKEAGSKKITVMSTTGIAVGTWLLLKSKDLIPNGGAEEYRGMIRRVTKIAGKELTLDVALYVELKTTPEAAILNLAPQLVIKGRGVWRQNEPSANKEEIFNIQYAFRPTWGEHVGIKEGGGPGIALYACVEADISADFEELLDNVGEGHLGYAINAYGPCRGGRVHDGSATRVRHAFTTGGPTKGFWGEPEGFVVESSYVVRSTTDAGLDTHFAGYGITFYPNVTGGTEAVQTRSTNTFIGSGTIDGALNNSVRAQSTASGTRVGAVLITNPAKASTVINAESAVTLEGTILPTLPAEVTLLAGGSTVTVLGASSLAGLEVSNAQLRVGASGLAAFKPVSIAAVTNPGAFKKGAQGFETEAEAKAVIEKLEALTTAMTAQRELNKKLGFEA